MIPGWVSVLPAIAAITIALTLRNVIPALLRAFGEGKAKVIKSHHNVGGLPERMKLKLIEPFNRAEMVRGLEDFSHIWVHFLFHQTETDGWKTTVRPPRLGGHERIGVWATRSPHPHNFMGPSVVRLKGIALSKGE